MPLRALVPESLVACFSVPSALLGILKVHRDCFVLGVNAFQ